MSRSVAQWQSLVEERLKALQLPDVPENLYAPVRYMLALGGKRMRPVALLMSADMFGAEMETAMPAALGIEVFHNFTLLHDDIMDKAPLRRGQSTVHEKWNADIAILSGDTMFVKSCQLMMNVPHATVTPVMDLFFRTAIEVCEGQQFDMDFQSISLVTIDDYLEMIRLKTAVLLGAGMGIGALIGGASANDAQHLYDFGVNLGVAFQLQDDILDVYGDAGKFGKQVGGDILANKKTYLLLTALNKASDEQRESLLRWLKTDGGEGKVQAVTEIFNSLGVKESAFAQMEKLYQVAMDHLKAIPLSEEDKKPLNDLAYMLMHRQQ
ncbi:MAG: polyprenyl synthetase family protein [Bacteroidia bacterium]